MTPEVELRSRLANLQSAMVKSQVEAAIVVQNADLFYFTGTIQNGLLYVPANGEPIYFVRKDVTRARRESRLMHVVPLPSLKDLPEILRNEGYPKAATLGFEMDVIPVAFFERLRTCFGAAVSVDIGMMIRRVRMIKSSYEISHMQRAAQQADAVYQRALEVLRAGMSQIELAAELERTARLDGHPGVIRMRSFNGEMLFAHVFAGSDSAVPAYLDTPLGGVGPHPSFGQGASSAPIERHQPVIVDTGSFAGGYLVDQTRVLAIGGLSDRLHQGYQDMVRTQELMRHHVKPGVTWASTYELCHEKATQLGYAEHFMGYRGAQASFIGHGLGIEIDELPIISKSFRDDVFEVGMTFAFEPKLVFPGEGAVGIENTFVVRPHGIEQLTFSDEAVGIVSV